MASFSIRGVSRTLSGIYSAISSFLLHTRIRTTSRFGKRLLATLLSSAGFVYLVLATYARQTAHPWMAGEWLISYGDGFQRRGLSGAVILWVSDALVINPLWLVLGVQVLLMFSSLLIVFSLLTLKDIPVIFVATTLGPMGILYFLVDPYVVGRKEVALYLFAILWFLFQVRATDENRNSRRDDLTLVLFSLSFSVLVLIHEGFVFFSPLLFSIFFILNLRGRVFLRSWLVKSAASIALPAVAVSAAILMSDNTSTFQGQCSPLTDRGLPEVICSGAIDWSTRAGVSGLVYSLSEVSKIVSGSIGYLVIAVLYWGLFVIQIRLFQSPQSRGKGLDLSIVGLGTLVALSLPIFIIAADWGRYMSMVFTILSLAFLVAHQKLFSLPEPNEGGQWKGIESPFQYLNPKGLVIGFVIVFHFLVGIDSYGGAYNSVAMNLTQQFLPYYLVKFFVG